jgi:hypothetical protein
VSVAVLNGRSRVLGGRLFSASRVGRGKSKQFTQDSVSVIRGQVTSQLMKSHPWMITANQFCQGLGNVPNSTAVTRSMLSGTKNEKG